MYFPIRNDMIEMHYRCLFHLRYEVDAETLLKTDNFALHSHSY